MGPCLASLTLCSGVNSQNFRFGSGGASRAGGLSIWPGLGWPGGVLKPTLMLDFWNVCARQADRASHNPPAASSAAIARDRCFAFIVFCFLIQVSNSLSPWHCARISGSWLSIWNEGGELWRQAPASRNEPDPQRGDYTLEIAVRSTPTATWIRLLLSSL